MTLVFEDMHFADTGLLDFIDHMLEWSRGHPIYIVTLARPELIERRPEWGAGKRNFNSLYVEPLEAEDMRELLAGLAPGLPQNAVDAIISRADGIPLYAVETVRMLVAEGRLVEQDGGYVPVGELGSLAVPGNADCAHPCPVGQPGQLGPGAHPRRCRSRPVVHHRCAGRAVRPAEAELDAQLRNLVRRELLVFSADARSPERGQYAFVQGLIREVAYNTLSKRDRKTRHLAAARYYEQVGSDELAGALAGHYVAAHSNASEKAEADALAAQARIALRGAADRAVRLAARDQAIVFLQQAVALTEDAAEQAAMLQAASVEASAIGKHGDAVELARRAAELRESLDDRLAAARAVDNLGSTLLNARLDDEARDVLEDAFGRYGDLWPDPSIASLKVHLARAIGQFGDNERAAKLADEALGIAEHADIPLLLTQALFTAGFTHARLGRLRAGVALIAAAEQVARENDLIEMVLVGLIIRGYTLGEVDNVELMRCYRAGADLARRSGRTADLHQFINNIGYSGFLTGEWDEALAGLDAVLEEDLDPATRLWLLSNELVIRVSRGDDTDAARKELSELAAQFTAPQISSAPLDPLANLAQAEGRFDDARRYFERAGELYDSQLAASTYQAARSATWAGDLGGVREYLATIDATGYHGPVVEARRKTLRADIAALEGDERTATALYLDAIKTWNELKVAWEEALTGLDMATVLDPATPEVAAVAASTRATFERLGAKPYLARLDAALSRDPKTRARAAAEVVPARSS